MASPLQSLIATGTKLWLDSIDPELVQLNRRIGATGATSNPVIVSDLIKTGRFDDRLERMLRDGLGDDAIAWKITDQLVRQAQEVFHPVWLETRGDDGYVSFELDPLLEDGVLGPPHRERVSRYVELGRQWSAGHDNRMIKVPATPAGIEALEALVAGGVTVNVTLIFSARQYGAARDAVWRGAQQRGRLDDFKSVYSIFVSRIDLYTEKHASRLSGSAQGQVGIVNAKRIWRENQQFWSEQPTRLKQEIIFASTGTKKPTDTPWKYVEAFAGDGIETNPPATNDATQASTAQFVRQVDAMPSQVVLDEIDRLVDFQHMEETLMSEGIAKFANPQKDLLALIAEKRAVMSV